MLDGVEGVMVLTREGHRHLEFASAALGRGLPTFVDKPLTCSLPEARSLLELSRKGLAGAGCFSSSSLRFAGEIQEIPRERLGRIVAIDAFGGGETLATMPGLWYYGCHTIEMVDAIWGPGVGRVRVLEGPDRDQVDLNYRDGRCARLRMERRGAGAFGATVHGERGVHQFHVDLTSIYARFVERLVRFFEGGVAPVDLRDIVETVAVMQSGDESAARGGEWIGVEEVR
jgi:predicted dehydrogenase